MLSFFKGSKEGATPDRPPAETPPAGWAGRLRQGLARTRENLGRQLGGLFGAHAKIDEALYEELETALLTADVGVEATGFLLEDLRRRVKRDGLSDSGELKDALKQALTELLAPLAQPLDVSGARPFVIMMAGVNGAGKTTSIGKLAKYFQTEGHSVLLAAGDTFRAAAREQLAVWGERNNVAVISQQGGDAAAVIFDAVQAARARGTDILLADTAGRLTTQLHLMEEIRKVKRVIAKADPGAPHEIILVLDANTGQNAVVQVKAFDEALGLTGLIVTKLDGTAKGGVLAAIARVRPVPIRFIGVGEGLDDLRPFDAREFVEALFE
ncbi:MAG: signal recognition particle-docking protein FtsY [Betaproteobacteria bacterium]|nr:signal recognition particle-docking protein FtsY [Betaproteobacteria bacterium]